MKIAMVGTRGVPASYSGFETCVENLGRRLVERGHEVVVYCRPHMVEGHYASYKGMRPVYLPTIPTKHLDTIVHTFLSTLHAGLVNRPDVALYFIAGNSPLAGLSRVLGVPSIINVDGIDSTRAKWSRPARRYLRWAEHNAPRFACRTVTDSRVLQDSYLVEHRASTQYIPYGSELEGVDSGEYLEQLKLHRHGYILFVGRLVPENNAHVVIEAFEGLRTDLKLVVVGDAPYAGDYQARLRARAARDERVVTTGYLFGDGYRELARNPAISVVASEVGGTHPVLLEAMAAGNCVVVNDHKPNLEVIGDAGASYSGAKGAADLRAVLQQLLDDSSRMDELRTRAAARAQEKYSWEAVTSAYEHLAYEVLEARVSAAVRSRHEEATVATVPPPRRRASPSHAVGPRPMKIAMIGQKGMPALHGGPERHVEELAVRMAARGHEIVVYTRPNYSGHSPPSYKGVRLVSLPSVDTRHLDAISHVAACSAHALRNGAELLHYHAEGPALLTWAPRVAGKGTIATIHGQDWRRDKWGPTAKAVLHVGEWMAIKIPQATICVSKTLAAELTTTYGRKVLYIPNGISVNPESDDGVLNEFGLEAGRYVLFAARLVPEKGAHYLIDAWRTGSFDGWKLAIVGGSSHTDQYVAALHAAASPDVVFTDWQHDARLASLFRRAALFVLPSDIEGLPLVLLEALGYGTPVLASDIPQNCEVMGSLGSTFAASSVDDLRRQLGECLAELPARRAAAATFTETAGHEYDWDAVTTRTLEVYESVLGLR